MPTADLFTATALLLAAFGILLVSCAILGRPAQRFGVPVVFLFLVIGMLAGSEGFGGIPLEDYHLAFRLGTAALIMILLDGGLNTSWHSIRQNAIPAILLATVGVGVTAALMAFFGHALGLSWIEAILLGAVTSSTDAAAVFAVLRGGGLNLPSRVGGTIELESGINDPMAVILTLAATAYYFGTAPSLAGLALDVPLQLGVGAAAGLLTGHAGRTLLSRFRLSTVGLYPAITLGLGLLCFGAATLFKGSGFLAVFTAAVILGQGPLPNRGALTRIHDALGWLSQVAMFLMLGLLVFPSQLVTVWKEGLLSALFLSLIARPAAVALCLLPLRYNWREIIYIGWVGLRGAVPIILATIPILAGVDGAMRVFNIVFFVAVMSAILPGATIGWVTRRLGMHVAAFPVPPAILEVNSTRPLNGDLISFYISESLAVCNVALSAIPFPADSGAALVIRDGQLIAARGGTVLLAGDHIYVFCRPEERPFIELLFGHPQG